jgi:hypothetical protein
MENEWFCFLQRKITNGSKKAIRGPIPEGWAPILQRLESMLNCIDA